MNLSEALKTRKGQLIAVCILLVISQVFLFLTLGKSVLKNIPNAEKIAKAQKELERQKKEYGRSLFRCKGSNKLRYRLKTRRIFKNTELFIL